MSHAGPRPAPLHAGVWTQPASTPRQGRPTVLILADLGNEQFDQLASTLRRRGMSAIRVHTGSPSSESGPGRAKTRWIRDHWLYGGCVRLAQLGEGRSRKLARAEVLDVLFNEPTAANAGLDDPHVRRLAEQSLAFARTPPEVLLDKFAINALLEQNGVRIPPQISALDASPAEAVARLGLPLIVKDRIGAAGVGVRLARSLEAVEAAVRQFGEADAFYQQYVDGEMVMYGVVADGDGPLIEHGIRVVAPQWALGPSGAVELFDDPELLEAGRAAMRALGCRGFAEIGFIRDADGRCWHIDANIRSWGNMISLLALGVDYVGAYAALLTGAPYSEPAPTTSERQAVVLPFALYKAIKSGSHRDIARELRRFALVCRRGPGVRYAGVISLKASSLLLLRLGRAVAAVAKPRRPR